MSAPSRESQSPEWAIRSVPPVASDGANTLPTPALYAASVVLSSLVVVSSPPQAARASVSVAPSAIAPATGRLLIW